MNHSFVFLFMHYYILCACAYLFLEIEYKFFAFKWNNQKKTYVKFYDVNESNKIIFQYKLIQMKNGGEIGMINLTTIFQLN